MMDERLLRTMVREAVIELYPKFGIDEKTFKTFRHLEIVPGDKAQYDPLGCRFLMPEDTSGWEPSFLDEAVGEEVSHYLHLELNPIHKTVESLYEQDNRVIACANLVETVGRYGAQIYCAPKGIKMHEVDWLGYLMANPDGGGVSMLYHRDAYQRASILFELHGEALLPRVARMSVVDAQRNLPRLAPMTFYERKILPKVDKIRRIEA